ncbi:unnamed protein product [Strongylus vulgaris]|uniref:Uncharacterized protein n=1 Tax=Strongylus vulgaris TaxID=40348 RepID=A0A3P7J492_STRVU|nr:unnamed protein product [Strongylus vulgaris]
MQTAMHNEEEEVEYNEILDVNELVVSEEIYVDEESEYEYPDDEAYFNKMVNEVKEIVYFETGTKKWRKRKLDADEYWMTSRKWKRSYKYFHLGNQERHQQVSQWKFDVLSVKQKVYTSPIPVL